MLLTLESRPLAEALRIGAAPWQALERACGTTENSNQLAHARAHWLDHRDSGLQVLSVGHGALANDGEWFALLVVEPRRQWLPQRRCRQNWVAAPGLDSAPLLHPEQRYSALDCLLGGLARLPEPASALALRHVMPADPVVEALRALCGHRQLGFSCRPERRGTLLECRCQSVPAALAGARGAPRTGEPAPGLARH